MIARLRGWIARFLADEDLDRDARRHQAAANRLDNTLRELLKR